MNTNPITSDALAASVIAVPPLARDESLRLHRAENARIIHHLESGGVNTLLYGGNAVLGHVALSEYAELLTMLRESAAEQSLVIPSVGPAFGLMMDQASILREHEFPTAMLLPTNDPTTPSGIALAMRRFVDRFGRPAVLYIKKDGAVDVQTIRSLVKDGLISWIKYAIVRDNPGDDPFLRAMIDAVGPELIVSGMGEQPAIIHLRDFGLIGFTSGCVCIAPRLSMRMLREAKEGRYTDADQTRALFHPLEFLRDQINPVRVLHAAVSLAGIGETGPILPPLSPISADAMEKVAAAARRLATEEAEFGARSKGDHER